MPVVAPTSGPDCSIGIYQSLNSGDESITSPYGEVLRNSELYRSSFWASRAGFADARRRLVAASALPRGWDTYDADPPNDFARELSKRILLLLEDAALTPARLLPSSEGGVTLSFIEGDNRAEIEVYNTGEIATAIYSDDVDPTVREVEATRDALVEAITNIRVHLAA